MLFVLSAGTTDADAQGEGSPKPVPSAAVAADAVESFRKIIQGVPAGIPHSLAALVKAKPSDTAAIKEWSDRHQELLSLAGPLAGQVTNGAAFSVRGQNRIAVVILDHHASGTVIVYNLTDKDLAKAYLAGQPDAPLKTTFAGTGLQIEVTKKNAPMPDPLATVVVVDFNQPPTFTHPTVQPGPDGVLVAHAKDAVVFGKNLRYEPEPNKNTLGYWTLPGDWARWSMVETKKGTYDVEVLQGCGKGSGGSEVEFHIGSTVLPMVVQDTGHFQNFVPRAIGRVQVEGGVEIKVVVKNKKGVAVMDLRQITLKPVKE